jgi:hypothetical protein
MKLISPIFVGRSQSAALGPSTVLVIWRDVVHALITREAAEQSNIFFGEGSLPRYDISDLHGLTSHECLRQLAILYDRTLQLANLERR